MDKIIKGLPDHEQHIDSLKEFTAARIGIGRTGVSIPIKQALALRLAHAHARDAVYSHLDVEKLTDQLKSFDLPILNLHSKAEYREEYLQRPDKGRKLKRSSANQLESFAGNYDVAIIIADGLSATAVNENTSQLLQQLIPLLTEAGLSIAPLCLVQQGRVAVGDKIAHLLGAKLSIMLIGERPGLSSADS